MKFKTILRSGLLLLALPLVIRAVASFRGENRFDRPVWRVQLRVISVRAPSTAYVTDMRISLNQQNETWLTYPPRIFDDFTYDLLLTNVDVLSDITDLLIIIDDRVGWCPNEIELIINETPYFEQRLKCPWVKDQRGRPWYLVRRTDIHANGSISLLPAARVALTPGWLRSLTKTAVNHAIHKDGSRWGHITGREVEVGLVDVQTVHVDLDLASETPYPVHVVWDIRLHCRNDQLAAAVENYQATSTITTSDGVVERILDERLQLVDSATAYLLETLARWRANSAPPDPLENYAIAQCPSF